MRRRHLVHQVLGPIDVVIDSQFNPVDIQERPSRSPRQALIPIHQRAIARQRLQQRRRLIHQTWISVNTEHRYLRPCHGGIE
jgi:hypothetical protein